MQKKLNRLGKNISHKPEIQGISNKGIWIYVNREELFMPFSTFPWFLKATIGEIYNFKVFHKKHLYWPELDIDIDIESIKRPHAFPLEYSTRL